MTFDKRGRWVWRASVCAGVAGQERHTRVKVEELFSFIPRIGVGENRVNISKGEWLGTHPRGWVVRRCALLSEQGRTTMHLALGHAAKMTFKTLAVSELMTTSPIQWKWKILFKWTISTMQTRTRGILRVFLKEGLKLRTWVNMGGVCSLWGRSCGWLYCLLWSYSQVQYDKWREL